MNFSASIYLSEQSSVFFINQLRSVFVYSICLIIFNQLIAACIKNGYFGHTCKALFYLFVSVLSVKFSVYGHATSYTRKTLPAILSDTIRHIQNWFSIEKNDIFFVSNLAENRIFNFFNNRPFNNQIRVLVCLVHWW